MPRRFPIFQFPNRPLIVTLLAAALAWAGDGRFSLGAKLLSRLALVVWSAEEIACGANWFRRLLGIAGAGYSLARLATLARTRATRRGALSASAAPRDATASAR